FKIEIWLNMDAFCGCVLRMVGQAQPILIEVVKKGALEIGFGVNEARKTTILLIISWPALSGRNVAARQRKQEVPDFMPIKIPMVWLIGVAQEAIVAGGRAPIFPI